MAGTSTDLLWRGAETVRAACATLARHGKVEVQLPADYHHAVFTRLHPQASPGQAEEVDITGGAELIARISRIPGLDALARLEEVAAEAHARVRVVSPSPKVLITANDDAGRRRT